MTDPNEKYLARLGFWLRAGGTHSARTVSVLADVRTHLADSGENPYEAFGPARSYAKQFSEGSSWSWPRRAAGVVALVATVASCYSAANDIAYLRTQRPLWWTAPQWIVVVATVLLLLIGWRTLLHFASPPLVSLAGQGVDADRAWKNRMRLRRIVSLVLLIVVVFASGAWGTVLGRSYLDSHKLRITNYVYSGTSTIGGSTDTGVTVQTVIYLDAPGPATSLNMAALSARQDLSGFQLSSLQAFGSLAQALRVAKNINFSLSRDQLPGFTLHYGSYYVLTWTGAIYSTYTSIPSTQENLVITYLVTGVGLQTLRIPLAVNS
jgi:hypothetical protein